jgi:hypothetical protein
VKSGAAHRRSRLRSETRDGVDCAAPPQRISLAGIAKKWQIFGQAEGHSEKVGLTNVSGINSK